jgi:hypothetical protein
LASIYPNGPDQDQQLAKSASGRAELNNLVAWAENLFSQAKRMREPFERQWYMNLAFYFGRQYVVWMTPSSQTIARLYEPAAPTWRVRLVSNKCRPLIRNEVSKLTKEEPQAFVRPRGSDDDDLQAARAAEMISEYEMDELHFNRIMRRTVFWMCLLGTGFIKDSYNPDIPDPSGVPGRIVLEPVNAFHIYVLEPQEEDLELQPVVIHAMAKTRDWIKDQFGVDVAPDTNVSASLLEQRFLNAIGVSQQAPDQYVMVKEMWIKPCRKYPEGGVLTYANNQFLQEVKGWPYSHNEYPFSKVDHIQTGRFWGDSTLVDIIPLQREYNRTRSQIIEAKNRMSKPQLVAVRGSIDARKITSEPGLIIQYQPGFQKPEPLPLQSLPTYVIQEIDRVQKDIDDISGQYEIAKGRTPPGVTAASAIAYLQEENDSKLSSTTSSIEEATEKVGRHVLFHVHENWDQPRIVRVLGVNQTYEVEEFTKESINGNVDYSVEQGSSAPRSRAARQAMLVELGTRGWISPPQVLKYMHLVETDRMYDESLADDRQVSRENDKMMEGGEADMTLEPDETGTMQLTQVPPQPFPINEWDNDVAHIAGHEAYMKTQQYELAAEPQKQVLLEHLMAHKQRYQTQQMQAMQMAQPQGPPPIVGMGRPSPTQPAMPSMPPGGM